MRAYVIKTCNGKYATKNCDVGSFKEAVTNFLFSSKQAASMECIKEDGEKIVAVDIKIRKRIN